MNQKMRALYSLGLKMSDLHASVQRKRIELGSLQRTITLSTILKAQMWSLEDWSTLEGDYSHSLSETIQALSNVSTRLPFSSNIKVDIGDVGEALNSAVKVMETILLHIQNFVPKAEEIEKLISELARVIGGQRVEIQECGDLLSQTYALQVEECSLRSQLIQFHRSCPDIKQ
ncbi:protein ENDOSPERM DEFECTIVE 1-like isoform X1 [Carica papaya]|uniref:protein ENDOSPERM DEFECTIVE 1-like isoform X1 n=2 Tax=Carica papaya TaxID=3649 RepID=UPI000B8CDB05|nr:protein ENDOSPERM DEFECTIVE 1-like isoform X1 [Carica papaya]